MPSVVPQSSSLIITSCATSTRRRVRYPESAVFNAVSARPLRAPWVEMKYCNTVRPAEVGSDGSFDHFAGRLSHQSAHAGELANLLFRSASAGVRHNVNGVDVTIAVLGFQGFEHFVGNLLGDVAPDGDDFVVAFAVGDGAVKILLLHLDDFLFGVFHQLVLVAGDKHVVDANGDAGLRGVREAKLLQVIEQHDGAFQAETQVSVINELLDALFLEQAVDKRHLLRQMRIENDPADGGLDKFPLDVQDFRVGNVL